MPGELVDNWHDMTYRGKSVELGGEANILLFTSEPPGIEPSHPSLVAVDVWAAVAEGAHQSVFVVTPRCPRKAAGKGVRVIEISGLPQLREVVNKKITHFTQELYNKNPLSPLSAGLSRGPT